MKKWIVILLLCFVGPVLAELAPVHDAVLTTLDRGCAIHYLSHANTTGWYISEADGFCSDGYLSGEGYAVVRNAFGKEVGQLVGSFTQGYWTGNTPVPAVLDTLYLSDSESQTLTFDLGGEERLDIHYVGKLSATRRSDNTYGPFLGCEPAYILARTPDLELFSDEDVQQELISSVINRIKTICPEANQIYFYGSDKDNPENKEIAFFADINLTDHQIRVRRLPSSPRMQDILTDPADRTPTIPRPREVRHERALPVVQVQPIKSEKTPIAEPIPTPIAKPEMLPPVVEQPVSQPVAVVQTPVVETAVVEPAPVAEPSPSKPVYLDGIPNLLTISRLLKEPVVGRALVHVARFEEAGVAFVDAPVYLQVRGAGLSLGWGVVEGLFSYVEPEGTLSGIRGTVQVQSFVPEAVEE